MCQITRIASIVTGLTLAALTGLTSATDPCDSQLPPAECDLLLQEEEVLLIYYSGSDESKAIKNYYLTKYPGVIAFDICDADQNDDCPSESGGFEYEPYTTDSEDPYDFAAYPADNFATAYLITPGAYEAWIEAPVRAFIETWNANHDPDILCIVTTRGVPPFFQDSD